MEGVWRYSAQRRLPGGGAGRAARDTSQHDEAFGYQVGVGLKGRGHGGARGRAGGHKSWPLTFQQACF